MANVAHGRLVMANRRIDNNDDLWLIDVARGIPRRFVSDPASDTYPLWSPDGARLAFGSSRLHGSVVHDLFVKPISGADTRDRVAGVFGKQEPLDWSRDGRFIVYAVLSAKTGRSLGAPPGEDAKPFAFTQAPGNEIGAKFSPDGHWMTYQSDETGRSRFTCRGSLARPRARPYQRAVERIPSGATMDERLSTRGWMTASWPFRFDPSRQRGRWHTGRALLAATRRNIQHDSGRSTLSCQHVARRQRVSPDHRRVELEGIQSIVSPR